MTRDELGGSIVGQAAADTVLQFGISLILRVEFISRWGLSLHLLKLSSANATPSSNGSYPLGEYC